MELTGIILVVAFFVLLLLNEGIPAIAATSY